MSVYVIADVEVQNPEEYEAYVRGNTPLVEEHGGKFVVRGGRLHLLEGHWEPHRLVLIEFPDLAAARAWYDSPEYQGVRQIRLEHAETRLIAIIDGS